MSRFVRRNGPPDGVMSQQRLFGTQVAIGEPIQLEGNTEFRRDVESSLEIIAQERLREVEAQAKSLIVRAREESAKILDKANAEAKALLEQTQGEVDTIRENAHEEGFKTGYSEGYADATMQVTEETRQMLEGAQTLVDGAYLAEQRVMKHFESQTVELIRHIVKQILGRELSDSPETVMRMVERAIASLYVSGKVQVVVSAQIIHELREYTAATEQVVNGMSRFEFIADPVLDRNQIYIISQEGCFDLGPDTQLDHLLSALEPQLTLPRDLPEEVTSAPVALNPGSDSVAEPQVFSSLDQEEEPNVPQMITDDAEDLSSVDSIEVPLQSIELMMADEANLSNIQQQPHIEEPQQASDIAQAIEPDPVAWEEFPVDVQEMDGFPDLPNMESDKQAAEEAACLSQDPVPLADKETLS